VTAPAKAPIRKLFLDDIRPAYDKSWDLVKTFEEFKRYIETNGCPAVISFDHDLAFEHYPFNDFDTSPTIINYSLYETKTGYHAAEWLLNRGMCPKLVIVHSMNPIGAKNIERLFDRYTYRHGIQCEVKIHVYDPKKPVKILE
jgi:hypothetical protein